MYELNFRKNSHNLGIKLEDLSEATVGVFAVHRDEREKMQGVDMYSKQQSISKNNC